MIGRVVEDYILTRLRVEYGRSRRHAHLFDLGPRQRLPAKQTLLNGHAVRSQPDQAPMETMDEERRRAERRDPADEHRKSICKAAALEGDGAQYQLADAQ